MGVKLGTQMYKKNVLKATAGVMMMGGHRDYGIKGYNVVSFGRWLSTFRWNMLNLFRRCAYIPDRSAPRHGTWSVVSAGRGSQDV